MPTATPFAEAQQIAQSGGCFVTPRNGRYLVYRKTPARVVYRLGDGPSKRSLRRSSAKRDIDRSVIRGAEHGDDM